MATTQSVKNNKKKQDPKATAQPEPAQAQAEPVDEFDSEEGWEDLGTPEIDAWWHVSKGAVIQGEVCGRLKMPGINDDGVRDVVLVRLSRPAAGVQKGEQDPTEYPAGKVLGVTCRHRLMPLLECVRNSCLVQVTAVDKRSLGGGRTMWNFKLRVKGERAVPPPLRDMSQVDADSDGYQDGNVPF